MPAGMSREQALALVHEHIKNPNMVKHCLAAEAVLRALAERLGEDKEIWAPAGVMLREILQRQDGWREAALCAEGLIEFPSRRSRG